MKLALVKKRRAGALRGPPFVQRHGGRMFFPVDKVGGGKMREIVPPHAAARAVMAPVEEVENVEASLIVSHGHVPHPGVVVVGRPILDRSRNGTGIRRLGQGVRERGGRKRGLLHAGRENFSRGVGGPGYGVRGRRHVVVQQAVNEDRPARLREVERHVMGALRARERAERNSHAPADIADRRLDDGTRAVGHRKV